LTCWRDERRRTGWRRGTTRARHSEPGPEARRRRAHAERREEDAVPSIEDMVLCKEAVVLREEDTVLPREEVVLYEQATVFHEKDDVLLRQDVVLTTTVTVLL
jgi:hypothetical protein